MFIFLKFSNCCIIIAQTTFFQNIQYSKIYFHYGLVLAKTSYIDYAFFFWKILPFQILTFFKKSIFLKFSNCRIIIAQTTYFENIQYCKIYFQYIIGLAKTNYNDSAFFFKRYSHFKVCLFFKKVTFFSNFQIAA